MADRPDLETLLDKVRNGSTYREIGAEYGVNASTVCRWLAADDDAAQQSARAREDSAEAWLDRGMGYLVGALSKDSGMDAAAARALAQECARRAAIRNPRYRDQQKVEHSGPGGGAIPVKFEKMEIVVIDVKD